MSQSTQKIIYRPSSFVSISHGGGPLPLLGQDPDLMKQWAMIKSKYFAPSATIKKPDVIVIISAHYHSKVAKVLGTEKLKTIFDYGGFPPESYKYEFPAVNELPLAERIFGAFKKHPALSATAVLDEKWGADHGVFVPCLACFNKDASIPVVNVSVSATDDAAMQLSIGEALHNAFDFGAAAAAEQDENTVVKNVMLLASGSPGHNFDLIFNPPKDKKIDPSFNDALKKLLTDKDMSKEERKQKLLNWRETLPNNTIYQPIGGADHFMPLLSMIAAAGYEVPTFVEDYLCFNYQVSDFVWKY